MNKNKLIEEYADMLVNSWSHEEVVAFAKQRLSAEFKRLLEAKTNEEISNAQCFEELIKTSGN